MPRGNKVTWPPEVIARMGVDSDPAIARDMGVTTKTVRTERQRLGIEAQSTARWTPEVIARLGIDTDSEIAAELGISVSAVAQRRKSRGIDRSPSAVIVDARTWTPAEDALLGKESDRVIAKRLGISRSAVKTRRERLGIAAWEHLNADRRLPPSELVGARYYADRCAGMTHEGIAERYGCNTATVHDGIQRYLRATGQAGDGRGSAADREPNESAEIRKR